MKQGMAAAEVGFSDEGAVWRRRLVIAVWLTVLAAANAELPQPQLTSLFPCGGKAGESVAVKLSGTDLEGAALRFTHPGITSQADAKDPKKQVITIAKDVPSGRYDVRVAGTAGLSNPRVFQVGTLSEILENDKHGTRETAMEVALPCVINGTVGSQQDDWYKFSAKKGRKIVLRCLAQELDSKMVPALALYDATGRELRRERHQPVLEWQAKEDGLLFVQLNDYLYKGGAEFFYRLEIQDSAPAPSLAEGTLFWPLAKGARPEVEPNDAAHPQAITLPCEISGSFYPARDADVFSFHATKGELWWIEVTSQRLGLKTNPRVVVQHGDKDVLELNDGPVVPGMPDFDGAHLDPVGKFEVKEDGEYMLSVRDLANVAPDPARRYQLSIRKAAPDFALVAIPVPPKENKAGKDFTGPTVTVWNHNVRRGEMLPVRVIILRRDGFDGDLRLTAEGLPPGVTSCDTVVGGEVQDTMIFVSASEDAAPFTGTIKVIGTSNGLKHEARGTTTLWNLGVSDFIEPSHWRFTQEIALGVVADEAFPVALKTDGKPVEAKVGDKVKVHVSTVRRSGFKDPVKYKAAGISGLEKSAEFAPAATVNELDNEVDLGPLKLKPGTFTIWFAGSTKMKVKGKDATVNVYSNPVVLKVTEAPKKK